MSKHRKMNFPSRGLEYRTSLYTTPAKISIPAARSTRSSRIVLGHVGRTDEGEGEVESERIALRGLFRDGFVGGEGVDGGIVKRSGCVCVREREREQNRIVFLV